MHRRHRRPSCPNASPTPAMAPVRVSLAPPALAMPCLPGLTCLTSVYRFTPRHTSPLPSRTTLQHSVTPPAAARTRRFHVLLQPVALANAQSQFRAQQRPVDIFVDTGVLPHPFHKARCRRTHAGRATDGPVGASPSLPFPILSCSSWICATLPPRRSCHP